MKKIILLACASALLSGCIVNSASTQRILGYGPHQYCQAGDVCHQAGESHEWYPFAPGDATRFAQQGRECWAVENRANWDACTARLQ